MIWSKKNSAYQGTTQKMPEPENTLSLSPQNLHTPNERFHCGSPMKMADMSENALSLEVLFLYFQRMFVGIYIKQIYIYILPIFFSKKTNKQTNKSLHSTTSSLHVPPSPPPRIQLRI